MQINLAPSVGKPNLYPKIASQFLAHTIMSDNITSKENVIEKVGLWAHTCQNKFFNKSTVLPQLANANIIFNWLNLKSWRSSVWRREFIVDIGAYVSFFAFCLFTYVLESSYKKKIYTIISYSQGNGSDIELHHKLMYN